MSGTYMSNFRFRVITGKDGENNGSSFSRVSGIEVTMEQEEIQEGGKNDRPHILLSPHRKNPPLVLERGISNRGNWLNGVKPGMRLGTWLKIYLLDERGEMTDKIFEIADGIVVKWELSGLDAVGNSVLVERIEIVHDGIGYQ